MATARDSGRSATFASLEDPTYRRLWLGGLVSFLAVQMEFIARGWLAYELTGTNSGLGAVFLGNLPGSMSSVVGMRQEGRSRQYILTAWGLVALACTLATILGYSLLSGLPPQLTAAMLALAAGGILAMLADTMMPEAFENGGPLVALATATGFACAFLLSHLAG